MTLVVLGNWADWDGRVSAPADRVPDGHFQVFLHVRDYCELL